MADEDPPGPTAVAGGTAELLADADRDGSWMLLVDGTPQSHVDLDDPTHLEFEYVRRMGHVLDLAARRRAPLDVVHLGGGALTLPRYVAVTRPGSRSGWSRSTSRSPTSSATHLPLPRGRAHPGARRRRPGRPRGRCRTASADVVVTDVFAGARTPAHLTTVEFAAEAHRGAAAGRGLRGQRRRRPAAARSPAGQVGHAARGVPERLPAGRAGNACADDASATSSRRVRRRPAHRRPHPPLRAGPDARPRRGRRGPGPLRRSGPAGPDDAAQPPPSRPPASSAGSSGRPSGRLGGSGTAIRVHRHQPRCVAPRRACTSPRVTTMARPANGGRGAEALARSERDEVAGSPDEHLAVGRWWSARRSRRRYRPAR